MTVSPHCLDNCFVSNCNVQDLYSNFSNTIMLLVVVAQHAITLNCNVFRLNRKWSGVAIKVYDPGNKYRPPYVLVYTDVSNKSIGCRVLMRSYFMIAMLFALSVEIIFWFKFEALLVVHPRNLTCTMFTHVNWHWLRHSTACFGICLVHPLWRNLLFLIVVGMNCTKNTRMNIATIQSWPDSCSKM